MIFTGFDGICLERKPAAYGQRQRRDQQCSRVMSVSPIQFGLSPAALGGAALRVMSLANQGVEFLGRHRHRRDVETREPVAQAPARPSVLRVRHYSFFDQSRAASSPAGRCRPDDVVEIGVAISSVGRHYWQRRGALWLDTARPEAPFLIFGSEVAIANSRVDTARHDLGLKPPPRTAHARGKPA